jgi:hypothetical protein
MLLLFVEHYSVVTVVTEVVLIQQSRSSHPEISMTNVFTCHTELFVEEAFEACIARCI